MSTPSITAAAAESGILDGVIRAAVGAAESGHVPDIVLRAGIRRFCAQRLRDEARRAGADAQRDLVRTLRRSPIALHTDAANAQHYELPPAFFTLVLGRRRKYSSAYWPAGVRDLDSAEEAMLDLACRRAGLQDGMRVLDLGCGWGSLSLWIAERYPQCRVLAVSNSRPQADFIRAQLDGRGLGGVEVVTADVNSFEPGAQIDRILSVEMFEHVRNYERLLARLASWLAPQGRLFVHIFAHRAYAYPFETAGAADWMGRYFFTGGLMPSHDLLAHFQRDLTLEDHWWLDGQHYAHTANAWLANLDQRREQVLRLFADTYGPADAHRWLIRWRLFFLACAELFGFRAGREWGVTHCLFAPR